MPKWFQEAKKTKFKKIYVRMKLVKIEIYYKNYIREDIWDPAGITDKQNHKNLKI